MGTSSGTRVRDWASTTATGSGLARAASNSAWLDLGARFRAALPRSARSRGDMWVAAARRAPVPGFVSPLLPESLPRLVIDAPPPREPAPPTHYPARVGHPHVGPAGRTPSGPAVPGH
ncbi:hypothetical protein GCM10011583_14540 [Streptomyces camponoticapitis]|uniref:Uncharacterized protein n=1 Tax=Streptomyces camponoticapitis TaxID=1616125 RepID=A0ABQ2E1D4_9ACTN|nr:hypothetical protein GCM10011583_14540 [Streptomyces camponoticapitis]